jgi:hypothetical protein
VSEEAQADNMAQLILWASTASAWLKGLSLYELRDSGRNPAELEDNFGLYHFDNSPKPAACAVRGAWAFIRPSLKAEQKRLSAGIVSIAASTSSGARMALWSDDPNRRYEARLRGDAPNATFANPCDASARPAAGAWMPISSTPLLISTSGSIIPDLDIRPAR